MQTTSTRRRLRVAAAGFALVLLGILIVCAVLLLKQPSQGAAFLGMVLFLVVGGGLALLVASLMLPWRATWRGIVVILWSLLAVCSPLFGWVFLIPWGVLLLTSPLVLYVLLGWFRAP